MKEFFTLAEVIAVGSSSLPSDTGALSRLVEIKGWRSDPNRARQREGRGGGWEYHLSLFPAEVQARLTAAHIEIEERSTRGHALWDHFAKLPDSTKAAARARLAAVERVELLSAGVTRQAAVALVAKEISTSTSTLWGWLKTAASVPRPDRLPALAPRWSGRTATAECDPRAWEFLKADYLRPERPSFEASYRRTVDAATENGWSGIPSAKTLQRRLERECPRPMRTLMRQGREAAARTYPHQTRDRSVFRAMEAITADGHKFDVFVRFPDGTIGRPLMVALQDLYSGMIVGHRLDRSENWGAVRLAFRDAVESFGIPEHAYLDNGRAFASKWMTGRQATRFRFKIRDDEPEGILTGLGIQVHWTTPYHGQSKPIERAFRDMCDDIAKHPFCAGAYTGNTPEAKPENYASRAIEFEAFRAFVAREIARHNARVGRRTPTAKKRSFAETFRESYEHPLTLVRKATPVQLHELLLAAEAVTARAPDGSIHLADNRYWAEELVDFIGKKVVVRFDPQELLAPVAIYTLDGRFVAQADCIEKTGFNDIDAAREHAKKRNAYLRALREQRDLQITLAVDDLARLLPDPAPAEPPRAKVVRLVANGRGRPEIDDAPDPIDPERAAQGFGALLRDFDARGVVPFARKDGGHSRLD